MVFFKQIRNYIIGFLLFGMWSSWEDFQSKCLLRAYLILCIFTEICSYIFTIFFTDFYGGITLSSVLANSSVYLMMFVQIIIGIESFFTSNAQLQLIREFSLVDQLFFTKLGMNLPYHKCKRELFLRNTLLISFIIFIKITLWVYTRFVNPVLRFFYCTMFSSWIVRFRLIQVLLFVCLVRNRLILISKELNSIQNAKIIPIENDEMNKNSILIVNRVGNFNYERLIHLKQIYGKLYAIYGLINTIFGWSLLAIFVQNFYDFTSNCYWIYLIVEGSLHNNAVLIICIVLLLPIAVTWITLVFYCNSCTQQVK